MTKKCLICKAKPHATSNRSFHMFPKNEILRKKWLDALNLSTIPNFKVAHICSGHFDEKSFFDSDEYRQRKRLCSDAVPQRNIVDSLPSSTENVKNESKIYNINNSEISNLSTINVTLESKTDIETKINVKNESEIYNINNSEISNLPTINVTLESEIDIETEITVKNESEIYNINNSEISNLSTINISLKSETDKETEICSDKGSLTNYCNSNENDASKETHLSLDVCELANSKKRKCSSANITPVKKIRFMDGFKTEYIHREDFVSDESWEKFLKYVNYKKSKIAAAHNKNSRQKKKNLHLKDVIDVLERNEEFNVAEYLKDLPPHMKKLIIRMKEKSKTTPFPDNLKIFARTLYVHSPAAYEVVRVF